MEGNVGSKKALVIAVSNYDILHPLTFCLNDGNEMFELLKSLGYEILENHKLIGRVKWDDLRHAIIDFFRNRNVKPKDTLLFYYSGHGVLDGYGDHYLAPSELNPFESYTKGFLFEELTRMIDKSNSQRTVTILDCCYSGAAKIGKGGEEDAANAGRKAIDEKSRILERAEGKCILAASQAYQKAFETTQKNHSLFTYYLLEGLKGNEETVDSYGYITPDSLSKYVYNKIMSLPLDERPLQKPIRKVEQSGDIVLAYYPELAKIKTDYTVPQNISSVIEKTHPERNNEGSTYSQSISAFDLEDQLKKYIKEKKGRFSVPQCVRDFRELGINTSNSEIGDMVSRLYKKNK
jgi:hypothetical protein